MHTIIIKGEAYTDYNDLEKLDGVKCDEEFAGYFDKEFMFKDAIIEGYTTFKYERKKLWTITEYISTRLLTKEELETLADYTQGQWSDGIGEEFEQEPVYISDDGVEVYISMWSESQELYIYQQ